MKTQQEKAERFRNLHRRGEPLVLPNAWDAGSARVIERAGAQAVATTSAGVAAAFGYPDGECVPKDLVIATVRRITETVTIPVSVDIEAGYGKTPAAVCDTVNALLDAGAIGINLEDALEEPEVLVAKIRALRELAARRGVALFVNARTDVYLFRRGDASRFFPETVRRLQAYEAAGADGLFVPGLVEPETITALLREVRLPVNVLVWPGVASVAEFARLGIARISVGSGPMRAALTLTERITRELLERGTYDGFAEAMSHGEANRMFTREKGS
jgi:2-methylisocitrate lyase-like PEP mutase family enzyme